MSETKSMSDRDIQYEFRKMSRVISRLNAKARSARDLQVAAQTRAHDLKLRAKTAEYSLRGLSQKLQILREDCQRKDDLLLRWKAEGTEDYSLALDTDRELKQTPPDAKEPR